MCVYVSVSLCVCLCVCIYLCVHVCTHAFTTTTLSNTVTTSAHHRRRAPEHQSSFYLSPTPHQTRHTPPHPLHLSPPPPLCLNFCVSTPLCSLVSGTALLPVKPLLFVPRPPRIGYNLLHVNLQPDRGCPSLPRKTLPRPSSPVLPPLHLSLLSLCPCPPPPPPPLPPLCLPLLPPFLLHS